MKKIMTAMILTALLAGCQTAGEIRQQATAKANPFSCQQLTNSFAAYNRDRQSLDTLKLIATMTNTSTKGLTTQTADKYYARVRDNANLALVLQGCTPLE